METAEVITKIKWGVDPSHSEISFKIKHLKISNIKGVFKEYSASIYTTGEDFTTAEIDFWINPASIDTRDVKRDGHLAGPEFFDSEKFKEISFIGNTFEKSEIKSMYNLYGALTIKGISKQIKLNVEFGGVAKDPWGMEKAGFTITGILSRKDWGLTWNTALEMGGLLLGDDVFISCELQLIKES